jgi:hypothetical protein
LSEGLGVIPNDADLVLVNCSLVLV